MLNSDTDKIPPTIFRALALLLSGAFLMILNETVMSVAISTLMEEFSVTAASAQWLTTAFMLTMAVVIPMTGVILQRFSIRQVFFTAVALFTLGTTLCAVAMIFPMLVTGRVIQASGTALMLPLLMTTVMTFIPPHKRGRVMGMITVVIAVAPAIGPTFSGFVIQTLNWRWSFIIMLPLGLLILVIGSRLIQNIGERRPARFDVLSVILSATTFGGLIYGLSSIGEAVESRAPVSPYIPLGIGFLALLLFVARQIKLQETDTVLLDLRCFKRPAFTLGVIILLFSMSALFGTIILIPIYLQIIRGMETLQIGLILLPGGLTMGLVSPFIGRIYDRLGPRVLVVPGTAVVTSALLIMHTFSTSTPPALIIGSHMLLSLGLACVMTPLMTSVLGSLPRNLYTHGSAILNTLQQLAGAAGTALFITIMTLGVKKSGAADPITGTLHGIENAFLWGAALTSVAVICSFFIRKPNVSLVSHH